MSYLDNFGNEEELVLEFNDDVEDSSPEYITKIVSEVLEEFDFEEILQENDMEISEALGILFELGYIGLPRFISDEDEIKDYGTMESS